MTPENERLPDEKLLLRSLRKRLPEKKVKHCLSVSEYLTGLAEELELDREKARAAGILHDYCRKDKPDALLRRAREYGLEINHYQEQNPKLLHGPLAAEAAVREFGINDRDIYDALFWHTTGCPELCRLGQALYVADFCEPGRAYPEAAETRAIREAEGFDRALLFVAGTKIRLLEQKNIMDPVTREFHAWLLRVHTP